MALIHYLGSTKEPLRDLRLRTVERALFLLFLSLKMAKARMGRGEGAQGPENP